MGSFASYKSGAFYAIHHRKHHMICDDEKQHDPYGGFYSGFEYALIQFPSDQYLNNFQLKNYSEFNTCFHYMHHKIANYQGLMWFIGVCGMSIYNNNHFDLFRLLDDIVVFFAIPTLFNILWFILQTLPHLIPNKITKNGKCYPSNPLICGLLTGGEGYHGNHHKNPKSPKLGKKWYQIDFGYITIWFLKKIGIVDKIN